METDELIRIWTTGKESTALSRSDLEESFHKGLEDASRKLTRRIRLDLAIALLLVVLIIATAYFAGFRYWPEVAAWMSAFSLVLFLGYRMHISALSFPADDTPSLFSMIKLVRGRIYRLCWTFRLIIPVSVTLMYTWFVLRFDLITFAHLAWILPLTIVLNEVVIRLMYGPTKNELDKLLHQMSQPT